MEVFEVRFKNLDSGVLHSSMFGFKREPVRGSHGWQGWVFDSHRSAPSFARMRLESRLAGGRGSSSHLPGRGGKSERVCPKSLAALQRKAYVWSRPRRARGEGSGGEVKNALISRKGLVWSSKAISTKVKLSYSNLVYITWRPRYLVWVRGQWGSSLGRSVKVMRAIC